VTDFSRANFDDIEPMRPGPVEARFSRKALGGSEQIGVSRFRYAPNTAAPYGHHHDVQEEVYVVVSGSGQMKVGDEVFDLEAWDVVRVAPQAIRAIHAGPDGIELVVAGGERPPEGDGHLVEDFWP
jgi:mannose-6-phosphate isomerase-like protein (cupin superfamily)